MTDPRRNAPPGEGPEDRQLLATGFFPDPVPPRRRGRAVVSLVAALVGIAALLAFAPAARHAADGLPVAPKGSPGTTVTVTAREGRPARTGLRDLPIGLPVGTTVTTPEAVLPYATAALGATAAARLVALLAPSVDSVTATQVRRPSSGPMPTTPVYPYRYPALDSLFAHASASRFDRNALRLAAALTLLAAQPNLAVNHDVTNAGPIAYAVLDRARQSDGCSGQLDLLLLLSGDLLTTPSIFQQEEVRSDRACPGDPTADWLVGEAQMRQMVLFLSPEPTFVDRSTLGPLHASLVTFERLVDRLPHNPAALSGLGDADLHAAQLLSAAAPFTARHDFESAIIAYQSAAANGAGDEAELGIARAEVGLDEPGLAAKEAEPATKSPRPGDALEVMIEADEMAHQFSAAASSAHRLAGLGASAYPPAAVLFPMPSQAGLVGSTSDASLPLSVGAGSLAPFEDQLVLPGGAGGLVQDLSFVPLYRNDRGITGVDTVCPTWSERRDELLAGDAAAALSGWAKTFVSVRPGEVGSCWAGNLEALVQLEAHRTVTAKVSHEELLNQWQNVLRWAGNMPEARRVAAAWAASAAGEDGSASFYLGEIDFLERRYVAAAADFETSELQMVRSQGQETLGTDQAELDRGAALLASGRAAEALPLLRPLINVGAEGFAHQTRQFDPDAAEQFATVSYYAAEQLADQERATGDLHSAVDDYSTALQWSSAIAAGNGVVPEVLYNNEALAYLGLHDTKTAAALEARAVATDPDDPVFLMSAGFVAERGGQIGLAIADNERALANDPGAFPVANDLGVELADQDHDAAALVQLRHAVGADPQYALGWFNLGVLESRMGPAHLLASQGALAKAAFLDSTYKDRKLELTIDGSVYRTALDLSKPLPARWSLADLPRPAPAAAAGFLTILAAAVALSKAGKPSSDPTAKLLDPVSHWLGRFPSPSWLRPAVWAVAATVATFVLAGWRHTLSGTALGAYAVAVAVLVGVVLAARVAVARFLGINARHESWLPGVVVGLATGAVGYPWAPAPTVTTTNSRVHEAGPLALTLLSGALFFESAWLGVPLCESFAVAALVMSASMLLPIEPLDGAKVGKGGLIAGAGVVAGAVLVGLGVA